MTGAKPRGTSSAPARNSSRLAQRRSVGRPRHEVPSESYHQQRKSILATAGKLLEGGSYQTLSFARIAEAMDLSKASVYYYFKSKDHLLYALYEEYLDEQFNRMSEIISIRDSKVRLLGMLRCQIHGILNNLQIVRLRLSHFPLIEDPIVEQCIRKEARHTARLTAVIEAAIADGHLPPMDSFLLMELFFGMPLLVYRAHSTDEYSPKHIESQVAKLFGLG